jgi:hypothetical protein
MTGSEVQWGVLTLVESAPTTDTLDITATAMTTEETALAGSRGGLPQPTDRSDASCIRSSRLALVLAVGGVVSAVLLM